MARSKKAVVVSAPVVADVAPAAAPTTEMLYVTEQGMASAAREGLLTRQRSAKGFTRATWRPNGVTAPSLRAAALGTILAQCNDDGFIGRDAALAALGTINLGSKTPATRLSAFLRAGLLASA